MGYYWIGNKRSRIVLIGSSNSISRVIIKFDLSLSRGRKNFSFCWNKGLGG